MIRLINSFGMLCVACSGCGTLMNTNSITFGQEPPYRIYGGVRLDVEQGAEKLTEGLNGGKDAVDTLPESALWLSEIPICAVADTLTLLFVIAHQLAPPKAKVTSTTEPEVTETREQRTSKE